MKIALCDDDVGMRNAIKKRLDAFCIKNNKDCTFTYFSTIDELITAPFDYDLLFLDIMLDNGQDGIEAGKRLRSMGNHALFILTTSRTDRFAEGYEATVFRYLVKPIEQTKFDEAMLAVYAHLQSSAKVIPVRFNHHVDYVKLDDIIFVESYLRKRIVHAKTGKYQTSSTWAEIEPYLNDGAFYKQQIAYMLNFAHVKSVSKIAVTMDTGIQINFAKGKYNGFNDKFMEYLGKQL